MKERIHGYKMQYWKKGHCLFLGKLMSSYMLVTFKSLFAFSIGFRGCEDHICGSGWVDT